MFDHKTLILISYLRYVARGGDLTMMSVLRYVTLTLSLLMSYMCVCVCIYMEFLVKPEILTSYIYGPTFGNGASHLFLFAAQCFNIESM
jgi:hypothetical protein